VDLEGGRVIANGRDISAQLRNPELGMLTSKLTRLQVFRDKPPLQRRLARAGGVVLEGGYGSVVCPEAEVKFYSTRISTSGRSAGARSWAATAFPPTYETVKAEVTSGTGRTWSVISPSRQTQGALVLDFDRALSGSGRGANAGLAVEQAEMAVIDLEAHCLGARGWSSDSRVAAPSTCRLGSGAGGLEPTRDSPVARRGLFTKADCSGGSNGFGGLIRNSQTRNR